MLVTPLNVANCEFPDNLYYDVENDVWLSRGDFDLGRARVGITSVLIFVTGKVDRVKLRMEKKTVRRGESLATLESIRYFGAIRAPVTGSISSFNLELEKRPSIITESPYERGWVAEYKDFEASELSNLFYGEQAKPKLESRIKELRVRCFKALWDREEYAIGIECAATLRNLDEIFLKEPPGYTVHLITDDPTADIEITRWSWTTGNELVESRKEEKENLFHFIIRKR